MGEEATNGPADAAWRWLEQVIQKKPATEEAVWFGGFFDALCHSGLRISLVGGGRALCSFRVPAHLTDAEGNWQPGAISTVIDNVGAVAIMSAEGVLQISVDFTVSYFSPAKANEEVEIDARTVDHKERLTAVVVEVRKKEGRHLVAVGRQWMSSGRPIGIASVRKRSSRM